MPGPGLVDPAFAHLVSFSPRISVIHRAQMAGTRRPPRGTPRAHGLRVRVLLPLVACLAAACGGGGGSAVDAAAHPDAGPDDLRPDRIGFVNLIEGGGFLSVFALIQDRPELPTPVLAASDGECSVYVRPDPALCNPACTDGVCTATDVCTPYAVNASAGDITVTGLHDPLVFRPGPYGYTPDPPPSGDLFDAGAAITLTAPGDVSPGFTAALTGVPELAAPFQNLELVDDEDEAITWTAASAAKIQIALVVGWHGAPHEAVLVCETADDGAFTIPGGLIAQLPRASSGLEQHLSWIQRLDREVLASPAGPIEIVVGSQVPLYFSHP
jgi:hypothetical protein